LPVRARAEAEKPRRQQIVMVDEHARAKAECAELPASLAHDDAPNLEHPLTDDDLLADRHIELGEQLRAHQCATTGQEVVSIRHVILQHEFAIERKRRLHTAQLDDLRDRLGLVRRSRHRGSLDRRRPGELRFAGQRLVDDRPRLVGPWLLGRDEDVGGRQCASLGRHGGADALDDGAQGHDGPDTNCNAQEEEGEPSPGGAQLASGHAQHERHTATPGAGSALTRSVLPSRIRSMTSADAASSASCVTSTTVVSRAAFTV
jgi:hypothetical protein